MNVSPPVLISEREREGERREGEEGGRGRGYGKEGRRKGKLY